jgi:triosephosphate isomerase
MLKPLIAANWKMQLSLARSVALATAVRERVGQQEDVLTVLCPDFVSLAAVGDVVHGSHICLGAQNTHWRDNGPYTGEVGLGALVGLVSHVIVGHSERRALFGDTDDLVNRKVHAALQRGLTPIMCVGETDGQRDRGLTDEIVGRQVQAGLAGLDEELVADCVLAYEPVWAIGTGRAAQARDAQTVVSRTIRPQLESAFGRPVAASVRVLYGGSVSPDNCEAFMALPEIDGALVGTASLDADAFARIVEIARALPPR